MDLAKRLVAIVFPEGLVLLAVGVALHVNALRESLQTLAGFYPYAVFGVGLLLAWRFGRNQMFLALLVLALAERALAYTTLSVHGDAVYQAVTLLLPLNLAVLALLRERGMLSPSGLIRLSAVLLQAGVVVLATRWTWLVAPVEGWSLYPEALFRWTSLGDLPLLAFGAATAIMAARLVVRPGADSRGFLWALVAAFLGLNASGHTRSIYLATAGLLLTIAVIETSHSMAYRDGLTGLPARRALDEALVRIGGQYTVAMVDIDHFKKLNDTYGHDVGDQVLRMVAAKLSQVSGGGRAFRYGGEEFAILFPRRSADDTLLFLEAVRQEIEDTAFKLRGPNRPRKKPKQKPKGGRRSKRVTVTVSIGVAEPGGGRTTPLEVVDAADQALYRAKEGGRNRIEC
jgi:diguanylate cyclase (GGDEF)-like protein